MSVVGSGCARARVPHPHRSAAAGLVDAKDLHRLRLGQLLVGVRHERRVRDRPGQQPVGGDADGQPLADLLGDVPAQPPGQPRASRDLRALAPPPAAGRWHALHQHGR